MTETEEKLVEEMDKEFKIELGKQAFGSPSGKAKLVKKLLKFIPPHKTYVECFAGGAALYWGKEPSELSVLNDLDKEIAFAYSFIKNMDEDKANRLKAMNWSSSREQFFRLKDDIPQDEISRFYRFVYVTRLSYATDRSSYYDDGTNNAASFQKYIDKLLVLKDRMQNTQIYNTDYSDVILRYDSPDTLIYLDPPYAEKRKFQLPAFTQEDYQKMHDLLKNIKGKFMFSTNVLPWIKEMFSDFYIHNLTVLRTRDQKRKLDTEYLITNYETSIENEVDESTLGETGSADVAGAPIPSPPANGLMPIVIVDGNKKRKVRFEEDEFELTDEEIEELSVVQRGSGWCVIHGHPKNPESKTDKEPGAPIKCYYGAGAKEKAEAMHRAIIISKIKRGEMSDSLAQETVELSEFLKQLDGKYSYNITNINNSHIILLNSIKQV